MPNANVTHFWPSAGAWYEDELLKCLAERREACCTYLTSANPQEVRMFCNTLSENIRRFFHCSDRPACLSAKTVSVNPVYGGQAVCETVEFHIDGGRRMRVLIVSSPARQQNGRFLLCCHGTHASADYFIGTQGTPRTGHESEVGFGLPFLDAGYTLVCPDLPCFGDDYPEADRSTVRFTEYILRIDALGRLLGHGYVNEVVFRLMALNDYVFERYGSMLRSYDILGFSLGAQCAAAMFAVDDRLRAMLDYMGMSTFERELQNGNVFPPEKSYVLGSGFISAVGDHWTLNLASMPRPYYRFCCKDDPFVNYNGVQDIMQLRNLACARLGVQPSAYKEYDGSHRLLEDMALSGIRFLDDLNEAETSALSVSCPDERKRS